MRIYSITAFPNIRQPDRQIKLAYSWTNLCRFLGKQREPVAKIKQGAWSPASFQGKRANDNVTKLSCLVLDIDDSITIGQAGANLMVRGVKSYIHTSVSHTHENNRFRIVLPLANDIPAHEHTFYYRALRTWFAEVFGDNAVFDESAKDAARFYEVVKSRELDRFPHALVEAPVCRPDLLCEMEVTALLPRTRPS